jgi:hypothetical protein
MIYKAKQTMMTKKFPRKIYIFLEEGTSGVQVGDIEQVIV